MGSNYRFVGCRSLRLGLPFVGTQRPSVHLSLELVVYTLLLCSSAAIVVAQSTTSLHGVISAAKEAGLPGATVSIRDPQTGFTRTVASGPDGVYQLLQVPPATYNLEVTAPGFAP